MEAFGLPDYLQKIQDWVLAPEQAHVQRFDLSNLFIKVAGQPPAKMHPPEQVAVIRHMTLLGFTRGRQDLGRGCRETVFYRPAAR